MGALVVSATDEPYHTRCSKRCCAGARGQRRHNGHLRYASHSEHPGHAAGAILSGVPRLRRQIREHADGRRSKPSARASRCAIVLTNGTLARVKDMFGKRRNVSRFYQDYSSRGAGIPSTLVAVMPITNAANKRRIGHVVVAFDGTPILSQSVIQGVRGADEAMAEGLLYLRETNPAPAGMLCYFDTDSEPPRAMN